MKLSFKTLMNLREREHLTKLVLLFVPAIVYVLYAAYYSVNLVFWDNWNEVALLQKMTDGVLALKDFYGLHNEHRLFIPSLYGFCLNLIDGYNIRFLVLSFAFATVGSFLVIIKAVKEDFKFNEIPGFLILFGFMFFSLRSAGALFFPDYARAFVFLFAVLSLYLLKKDKLWGAVVFAVLGSFSFITGLFIWYAGIVQIALQSRAEKTKIYSLSVWILFAVAVHCLYFNGYRGNPAHPSPLAFLQSPGAFLIYTAGYAGGSFFWNFKYLREFFGVISCATLFYLSYLIIKNRGKLDGYQYYAGLAAFLFITMLSTAIGRLGFASNQSSRFCQHSIFFSCIVFVLLYFCETSHIKNKVTHGLYCAFRVFFILGIINYCVFAFRTADRNKKQSLQFVEMVKNYEQYPDRDLVKIYPDANLLKQRIEILKRRKLNVFRE